MRDFFIECKRTFLLAMPVMIAFVSQTAMGVVDTIMTGGFATTDMAAVALGLSIGMPVMALGTGLLLGLVPIIAQLDGAKKQHEIATQVQQGFWLALFFVLLILPSAYYFDAIINSFGEVEPELVRKAVGYLYAMAFALPAYLFSAVLQAQCEGMQNTKPAMVILLLGLAANIPVNYIFIYGFWGVPALGGIGCGIATAIIAWVMFFMMYGYVKYAPSMRCVNSKQRFAKPNLSVLISLFSLGLPIALSMFFEVVLFAVVALLIAPLGGTIVAAHQVALNFSTLMLVLPASLGVAATIRVGHRLGERSVSAAKTSSYAAFSLGILLAIGTAVFTFSLREQIALLYNDNPEVVALAAHLMFFAALFQISDAIQAIGGGVLRGYKETLSIFFITFTAYWLIGLPIGYALALTDIIVPAMGVAGFWIGFIFGLTTAASLMLCRIFVLQRKPAEHILARVSGAEYLNEPV
ncbi:MATE family efflux transporter [Serratia microhaemolytica]|uniref:MATE family efflux transporter n=1 Tax=Serratia microhaemolytica TaxID=2675110 RepID=UPI000FDEF2C9|nr:MATE family efflux transporter [Serratia microhaemolytica]